jgi:cytochrome d ubiquinol oxidase subunit I
MSNLELARWQFALTTMFHFIFVPLTIGLSWLVAIMQTAWRRTGNPDWLRLTRFFGKLLLINVAIGVATGLVQEFQFGMNWSSYSRFVGDVFGAPLAIEGLAAFFLESTFLGIWIFGWSRLSPRIHLATIYLAALGATLSAVFIMAANSWMQNPVGYTINKSTGRPQLNDIGAVFTNPVFLWSLAHVLMAAFVFASAVVVGVSCWHLRRKVEVAAFHKAAVLGLAILTPAVLLGLMTSARTAVTITTYQPMKTASMEALWDTESPASFSLFQLGGMTVGDQDPVFSLEVPHLLSVLATGTWNGEVQGINPLQSQSEQQFGDGSYIPVVRFSYWSLRIMAYLGSLMLVFGAYGLWLCHRKKLDTSFRYQRLMSWAVVLPIFINLAGWVLAETGRQPWVVWGLQKTADGVSPGVSAWQVGTTVAGFVALYAVLAAVDITLMTKFARKGLDPSPVPEGDEDDADGHTKIPAMSY